MLGAVRNNLVAHLDKRIEGSDAWSKRRRLTVADRSRARLQADEAASARVAKRTTTTERQRAIFSALEVSEPAAFQDFVLPEPPA